MRVHSAALLGLIAGIAIGAIALGFIKVGQELQANIALVTWEVVVVTTIVPFLGYLKQDWMVRGQLGGFINGLGTGLGVFLLAASIRI
jgi:hypothetical protein